MPRTSCPAVILIFAPKYGASQRRFSPPFSFEYIRVASDLEVALQETCPFDGKRPRAAVIWAVSRVLDMNTACR